MSTGADAKTMPVSREYEEGYERAFGARGEVKRGVFVMRCSGCDGVQHEPETKLYLCERCKQWTYGSVDASIAPPLSSGEAAVNAPIMAGRFYENTVSPIDGSDIGSRERHREHMKRHGLTTADDFDKPGGAWEKARTLREAIRSGQAVGNNRKSRRESIERAMYQLRKP